MTRINRDDTKSKRALELYEKGLESWQIAERLGISERQVGTFVANGKKQRDRAARVSS